jgi:hypothetical protein
MKTTRSVCIHTSIPSTSLNPERSYKPTKMLNALSRIFHRHSRRSHQRLRDTKDDTIFEKSLQYPITKEPTVEYSREDRFSVIVSQQESLLGRRTTTGKPTGLRKPVRKLSLQKETFSVRPAIVQVSGLRKKITNTTTNGAKGGRSTMPLRF